MKGIIVYHSNTGNTKTICDLIRDKVPEANFMLLDIASTPFLNVDEYDVFVFAAYTYELQVPKLMVNFINRMTDGKNKPTFVFNTYGSFSVRTLPQMISLIKRKKFSVINGISIHTPENYPPMIKRGFPFADEPGENEIQKLKEYIASIKEYLNNKAKTKKYIINQPIINKIMPPVPFFLSKMEMGAKKVNKQKCKQCKLCVKTCPVHAIEFDEYPKFNEKLCLYCWKCYNKCAQGAIETKSFSGECRYPVPSKEYLNKIKSIE